MFTHKKNTAVFRTCIRNDYFDLEIKNSFVRFLSALDNRTFVQEALLSVTPNNKLRGPYVHLKKIGVAQMARNSHVMQQEGNCQVQNNPPLASILEP